MYRSKLESLLEFSHNKLLILIALKTPYCVLTANNEIKNIFTDKTLVSHTKPKQYFVSDIYEYIFCVYVYVYIYSKSMP